MSLSLALSYTHTHTLLLALSGEQAAERILGLWFGGVSDAMLWQPCFPRESTGVRAQVLQLIEKKKLRSPQTFKHTQTAAALCYIVLATVLLR